MPFLNQQASNGDAVTKELWRPSNPEQSQIFDFKCLVSKKHAISLSGYPDLWEWSVSEPANFWEEVWHYTGIKAHKPYDEVCVPPLNARFPISRAFEWVDSFFQAVNL